MKAIGITGYNGAQDRIAKMLGYFDKDNRQKNNPSLSEKVVIRFANKK